MIIKRPGSCRCGDPTYDCKIACTCSGPDPDHAPGCHYHLWRDVPSWADSINTGENMTLPIELHSCPPIEGLNRLRDHCHLVSVKSGWWHMKALKALDMSTTIPKELERSARTEIVSGHVATKFALIHSKISEALEGYRKDAKDSHLPDLPAVDVELADALIRIFDLAGYLGCDLSTAVERKMRYNATRKDHKPEAREAPGGKKF